MYIPWKSFLLSARSSFVWTEWKLNSQNSQAAQGEFQLPLTCLGSELCWVYLLSNLKMGAKTRRACQLAIKTQDKHHKTCLTLQPLAEKSPVSGLIETDASLNLRTMTVPVWSSPRERSHVHLPLLFCIFFDRMFIWGSVLFSGGHMAPGSGRTLRRHALRPVLLRTCEYLQC